MSTTKSPLAKALGLFVCLCNREVITSRSISIDRLCYYGEMKSSHNILSDGAIAVDVEKTDAHFSEAYDKDRTDKTGYAKFLIVLNVTAGDDSVYVPVSIGSGRVSTGFVYQIEGSDVGTGTASISSSGEKLTLVSAGSIKYCKISPRMTVEFKMSVHVSGTMKKEYSINIARINYKFNPNDSRYKRFLIDISTKRVKFK